MELIDSKFLQTERLLLMPLTFEITSSLLSGSSEELEKLGIKASTGWPTKDSLDILPIIGRTLKNDNRLAGYEFCMIVRKDNMQVIGDIGLHGAPNDKGEVEVGFGLVESERAKGYGYEALSKFIDWLNSQDHIKVVKADCLIDNLPSARILTKVGMKEVRRSNDFIFWEYVKAVKKKQVLAFIFDGMADYQTTFIHHLINTSVDKEVIPIAYEDNLTLGRTGFLYKPARLVSDILNEDADGLIITGGWYGDIRPELIELIHCMNSKEKLIGGICGAGTMALAKSGILNHLKYTTPVVEWTPAHKSAFGEIDPFPRENLVSERVVRDGNVITSIGFAFIDFAMEICDWFGFFDNQEERDHFTSSFKG